MLEREFGYKPPIPEDLQRQYETALHGVLRWKNGNWADNIYETDMDHVAGMFVILEDLNNFCPTLSSDINKKTVQDMICMHDGGEILVGDLTHGRDDYDIVYSRWKKREHAAFRLLTQKIEDPELRNIARMLYKRYVTQDSNDKEALLTKLIDVDQGLRFGYPHVFNGREDIMTEEEREMRFSRNMELLSRPTKPLLRLISPSAQTELKYFLTQELERFSQYGYQEEAAPYIRNLDAILK